MKKLTSQQEDVVKPLFQQIAMRNEKIVELEELKTISNKNLKMFSSIVRFPRLCDQYRRLAKKRNTNQEEKLAEKQATMVLRQFKMDSEPTEVLGQMIKDLERYEVIGQQQQILSPKIK